MSHNRKLVLGGVALTQAKMPARKSALAMGRARDDLEKEMIESGYLLDAPFKWVGLIIREGLIDESVPHYQNIDCKDGELPLAIEVDANRLLSSSEEEMVNIYRKAALIALVYVGNKYRLKVDHLEMLLKAN